MQPMSRLFAGHVGLGHKVRQQSACACWLIWSGHLGCADGQGENSSTDSSPVYLQLLLGTEAPVMVLKHRPFFFTSSVCHTFFNFH